MLNRRIHRGAAIVLGLFIVTHLAVHLTALWGSDAHIAALQTVQRIYRNPLGETALLLAVVLQIITGARRLRFSETSLVGKVQAVSGVYLILFLIIHTSAALFTRQVFGIDTNFYWAAGSLHYDPIRSGFALYYFAAIVAVFAHWGAAVRKAWPRAAKPVFVALPIVGIFLAALILSAFWGMLYPIDIPSDAKAYFGHVFGFLGVKP